jgi:hypothetical protein
MVHLMKHAAWQLMQGGKITMLDLLIMHKSASYTMLA